MEPTEEKNEPITRKKKRKRIALYISAAVCFLAGIILIHLTEWYLELYDNSLAALLYTLSIPQQGAGAGTVNEVIASVAQPILTIFGIYALLLAACCSEKLRTAAGKRTRRPEGTRKAMRAATGVLVAAGFLTLAGGPVWAFFRLDVPEYIQRMRAQTHIYEQEYIAPDSVALEAPADKPNLIFLYLESMETTYASEEEGGIQDVNYIPGLTQLAYENISFSNTDKLGGMRSNDNTNWTMAAIFAGTSGLPFAYPVENNSMWKYSTFAPSLVTLGDLLEREGYTQEFICGSDAAYGGRELYFRTHGNYAIYDLWKARETGAIPEDYYVFWGFEDKVMFRIAREELTRLWEEGTPFNLTLLTVDAHHLGGYLCDECGDEYPEKTANVIACTDRQVTAFVEWCRQQPFWENTVMILCGDHPRMDTYLTEDVPFQERTVYNCFLNARKEPVEGATTFRDAAMMDLFPTTLSAMGWEIPGNRLGLGTDLFSGEKTVTERMGYEKQNEEMMKYSQYFVDHFAK